MKTKAAQFALYFMPMEPCRAEVSSNFKTNDGSQLVKSFFTTWCAFNSLKIWQRLPITGKSNGQVDRYYCSIVPTLDHHLAEQIRDADHYTQPLTSICNTESQHATEVFLSTEILLPEPSYALEHDWVTGILRDLPVSTLPCIFKKKLLHGPAALKLPGSQRL